MSSTLGDLKHKLRENEVEKMTKKRLLSWERMLIAIRLGNGGLWSKPSKLHETSRRSLGYFMNHLSRDKCHDSAYIKLTIIYLHKLWEKKSIFEKQGTSRSALCTSTRAELGVNFWYLTLKICLTRNQEIPANA